MTIGLIIIIISLLCFLSYILWISIPSIKKRSHKEGFDQGWDTGFVECIEDDSYKSNEEELLKKGRLEGWDAHMEFIERTGIGRPEDV
jgi:hypothetical protein